jgi:ferritin-like metal-binding protein YciE
MTRELLVAWLNDAYAMERAHVNALHQYLKDFDEFIDVRSELRQNLTDTKELLSALEEAIVTLGGQVLHISLKESSMVVEGSASTFHDELIKDIVLLYSAQHFGYVSYLALAEAASTIEEDEIADMCERAAEEKRVMADWAEEQIPMAVALSIKAAAED